MMQPRQDNVPQSAPHSQHTPQTHYHQPSLPTNTSPAQHGISHRHHPHPHTNHHTHSTPAPRARHSYAPSSSSHYSLHAPQQRPGSTSLPPDHQRRPNDVEVP